MDEIDRILTGSECIKFKRETDYKLISSEFYWK